MQVIVDGTKYDYDATRLLISEAMEVKQRTGLNMQAWQQGLADIDPYAVKVLVYLLKKRAGESPDWDTLDFDLGGLEMVEDEVPDGPKEDAADA